MAKATDADTLGDAAFSATRLPPRIFAAPGAPISSVQDAFVGEAAALGKHWSQSMTVWGGTIMPIVTLLGPPVLSAITGVPVSAEAAKIFGEQVLQLAQAASVVGGAGMVLWGRARAAGPLERRDVTLRV